MNSSASKRHRLGFVLGAIILPPKADAAIAAIEKTAVGDGDAVRVAAEIVEDLRGAGKRAFGKDDPGRFRERFEIFGEGGQIAQPGKLADKGDAAGVERRAQPCEEQVNFARRNTVLQHNPPPIIANMLQAVLKKLRGGGDFFFKFRLG